VETVPRPGAVRIRRRRRVGVALGGLLALVVFIGVGGHRLYNDPVVDELAPGQQVDAVVALGGLTATAMYAQSLVQQGAAPVLVLSDPYDPGGGKSVKAACSSRPTGYRIICFVPDPATTRGEARQIRDLAKANGWTNVAVVAPTFHISRARLLVRRCFPGTLLMLPLPTHVPWDNWTYQYVRQTAGFAKAAVLRRC
jgi:uncharacterized SAM-binding protein YcdF (DUF218 family)